MGSVISGFANGDSVARDRDGRVLGHSNDRFNNTRDGSGNLVSRNVADVRLLFNRYPR
jgi:YD repeat-containing protein